MDDRTHIHDLLTAVALALLDTLEHDGDIRSVRDRTLRLLPDLDGALIEDLLVSAAAQLTTVDPDVDALRRHWDVPLLRTAASRLVDALRTTRDRP